MGSVTMLILVLRVFGWCWRPGHVKNQFLFRFFIAIPVLMGGIRPRCGGAAGARNCAHLVALVEDVPSPVAASPYVPFSLITDRAPGQGTIALEQPWSRPESVEPQLKCALLGLFVW